MSGAAPTRVMELARALEGAGARTFLVGGWVRERVARHLGGDPGGPVESEIDLEVYHLPAGKLAEILARFGRVSLVGEAFSVYRVAADPSEGDAGGPVHFDVSLPRRDSKVAPGHRGFAITGDPDLSLQEATRRRDFTVNAMLYDPLKSELVDLWGGAADLKAGVLRAVDPATFVEDSLRVLRAVQLAARLEFQIEPGTVELCRRVPLGDLPAERIWGEMEKLLLKARRPSLGLHWADRLGVVDKLFPELSALKGCPQDPEWHPEGDVWIHTQLCLDRAVEELEGLGRERKIAVMLAVLCHDFGKPSTTALLDGRLRSYDHEAAGVEPTRAFLDRLNLHTLEGFDLREQVIQLVAHHLTPSHFHKNREGVGDGAFRRLARKLEPELLYRLSRADCLGRTGEFSTEAQEWFIEKVRSLGVEQGPPSPILM
ncbi:MAG TPA: HD domain-containing protein, partial [Candidatus Polarisedimenticolia bacterium]|nr:HD domain-containing protein [Candidatus Polarisedimenticolia bacterium]